MCEAMKTLMQDEMLAAQREGEAIGEARGEMKAKQETAFELNKMGFSAEKIAKAVKVNLETVKEWLSGTPLWLKAETASK